MLFRRRTQEFIHMMGSLCWVPSVCNLSDTLQLPWAPFSVFWLERKRFSFPAPLSTSHSCDCLQDKVVRGWREQNQWISSCSWDHNPYQQKDVSHIWLPMSLLPPPIHNFMGVRAGENGKKHKGKTRDSFSIPTPRPTGFPFLLLRLEWEGSPWTSPCLTQCPLPGLGLPLSLDWKVCYGEKNKTSFLPHPSASTCLSGSTQTADPCKLSSDCSCIQSERLECAYCILTRIRTLSFNVKIFINSWLSLNKLFILWQLASFCQSHNHSIVRSM